MQEKQNKTDPHKTKSTYSLLTELDIDYSQDAPPLRAVLFVEKKSENILSEVTLIEKVAEGSASS